MSTSNFTRSSRLREVYANKSPTRLATHFAHHNPLTTPHLKPNPEDDKLLQPAKIKTEMDYFDLLPYRLRSLCAEHNICATNLYNILQSGINETTLTQLIEEQLVKYYKTQTWSTR